MTWAALHTFVVNEVVTAATLNTQFGNFNETAPGKAAAAGDTFYGTALNAIARLAAGAAYKPLRMNSGATAPEWAGAMLRQAPVFVTASVISLSTSLTDVVSSSIVALTGGLVVVLGIIQITENKSGAALGTYGAAVDLDGATVEAAGEDSYFNAAATQTTNIPLLYSSTPAAGNHTYKLRATYVNRSSSSVTANAYLLIVEFS